MMKWLLLILSTIVLYEILILVDKKIKGTGSIIKKVGSVLFFVTLLLGIVYFYGQTILDTFSVDAKSFTNIKAFFSSRIIGALAVVLLFLFVFFKTFYIKIAFKNNGKSITKEEKAVALVAVFFDIAVIPNIALFSSFNVLFVVLAIISMVETGLALHELVFSISFNKIKGVLA